MNEVLALPFELKDGAAVITAGTPSPFTLWYVAPRGKHISFDVASFYSYWRAAELAGLP